MNIEEAKRIIMQTGYQSYECGLVSAAGGNISMRVGSRYLITATNAPLRSLRQEDILEVDADGNLVGDDYGGRRPSKELFLHLAVMKHRPDIDSVIHVHPVYSITCSVASPNNFPISTIPAKYKLGAVGYIDELKPGSQELADAINQIFEQSDDTMKTVIMKRHGIIVFDDGMEKCFERVQLADESARVGMYLKLLGCC